MTKLIWIMILTASFALCAPTLKAQVLNSPQISAEDVKEIRKIIADRDYEKARADEAERQRAAWQASSEKWQGLYTSEKKRADEIQGGRLEEKDNVITQLRQQAADDRQEIGRLNFQVEKYKGQRKWFFVAGAGAGAAVGAYGGFQAGKRYGVRFAF